MYTIKLWDLFGIHMLLCRVIHAQYQQSIKTNMLKETNKWTIGTTLDKLQDMSYKRNI